jgi:predicted lactoylglutathione lyase
MCAVKKRVATVLSLAENLGGKIIKPAQDTSWGGFSGYFADPDEHLWEIAWNPFFWIE